MIDIPSVSGDERALADRIEQTLRGSSHLEVVRQGNTVAARTALQRAQRVIVAGHIDTVPLGRAGYSRVEGGLLYGRGSVDMKSQLANQLKVATELTSPRVDVTWIFYDQEEVAAERNGLGHFHQAHPDWMVADAAVLGEPSQAGVEGGCNGTMRIELRAVGQSAHSARPWRGDNAIHQLAAPLALLSTYEPETRRVDGLDYRESLSAVGIQGGIAGNVVPDAASLTINYRFAPDRSAEQATAHLRELFDGWEIHVTDVAEGARPGVDQALLGDLVALSGKPAAPKYGWTDVARFSALGIPAVNFGPGDGGLAHSDTENVPISEVEECYRMLREWLA